MTLENKPNNLSYSGSNFLKDLERKWGGKLYMAVAPTYTERLKDISALAYPSLGVVYDYNIKEERHPGTISISGNIASDFREHLITSMPHVGEAQSRVHLLADPFCRGVLYDRVNNFLKACAQTPDDDKSFAVDDQLPFELDGPDGIMFAIPFALPNLGAYFEYAKTKAGSLAKQLDLIEKERSQFEEEFKLGMERFKNYIQLADKDKDGDLHSIIQVISRIALAHYLLNLKSKGSGLLF